MKISIPAVFLFASLFVPFPPDGTQQDNPANRDQTATHYASQSAQPAMIVVDNQDRTQNDKQPAESHPQNPSWWNADHGTWALVVVGLLGTGAAVWTLAAMKQQTRVNRDVLIAMQRPKVVKYVFLTPEETQKNELEFRW